MKTENNILAKFLIKNLIALLKRMSIEDYDVELSELYKKLELTWEERV
jgi:hypothetical protein